jgi:hypothetical protein
LLSDPELWLRLQTESRALITERYTWRQLFIQMHRTMEAGLRDKMNTASDRTAQRLQHAG